MTSLHELLLRAVALAPAWPALGALLLGVLSVRGRAIRESNVSSPIEPQRSNPGMLAAA